MTAAGDRLYFSADDGTNGKELWTSMGTTSTTQMVSNLVASGSSNPARLKWGGDHLFFTAEIDADSRRRFWQSETFQKQQDMPPKCIPLMIQSTLGRFPSLEGTCTSGISGDILFYWNPSMEVMGVVQIHTWHSYQNLTVVSDNHLAVNVSWNVMFDGTYLSSLFTTGHYGAISTIIPPDVNGFYL